MNFHFTEINDVYHTGRANHQIRFTSDKYENTLYRAPSQQFVHYQKLHFDRHFGKAWIERIAGRHTHIVMSVTASNIALHYEKLSVQ